jgi:hypothetical protein
MTRHDAVIVFALYYFLTLIYFHSLTRTHLLTLVYMIENHSKPDATPHPYLFSGHLIHWPHPFHSCCSTPSSIAQYVWTYSRPINQSHTASCVTWSNSADSDDNAKLYPPFLYFLVKIMMSKR